MKRKILALGIAVVLAGMSFAGCGGSSSSDSSSEASSAQSESESTSSEESSEASDEASSESSSETDDGEVSETLQRLREEGTIVIAGSGTAPFGFRDTTTGELSGIDLEISMAIAEKLGIENVEYVVTTFDNLIAELQAGNCDVISSAMYITEARQEVISFSNVYYEEGEGILYREEAGYESLEDMDGLVCAIEQGSGHVTVAEQYVEEGYFERLDTYQSIDDVVLALRTGKADVAMADNVALAYMSTMEINQEEGLVLLDPYEMLYAGNIGAGFSKEDPAFIEEWNAALQELKEDGTVFEIMEKYGLTDAFYVEIGDDVTVNP